ncbi:hypothetical protein HYT33_01445 [Candidatus Roizmanbacteria bacterium]|nr:hypothetical protein [Candidatus Roizmanbacteria bacterium]
MRKSKNEDRKRKNNREKLKTFYILVVAFTSSILVLSFGSVFAANYESERYRIQFGEVNIGGANLNSANYDLSVSLGQTAAEEFQSQGYIVKAGFQYLHSIIPFQFSITDVSIDLGTLSPNKPQTAQTTLIVSFGGAGQYQVTAAEENPLRALSGKTIEDTSCNGEAHTCTDTSAKLWTSNASYGFGYNMSGDDVPQDFINSNYYRPFPDLSNNEPPQIVMSNQDVGKNRQAVVTFKANISPSQEVGSYQTVVKFTATPSY